MLSESEKREYKREYARKWRKKNLDKVKESQKRWRERNIEKVREYRREYAKMWRNKYPERHKEYCRNYYLRNRERIRKYHEKYRKEHPDFYKKMSERNKYRYRTDPEYREKVKESWKRWYAKNRMKILKKRMGDTRYLQPFTIGLECGYCGFGIKCVTAGRLSMKSFVKCPRCGFTHRRGELKKVKIPRYIAVVPVDKIASKTRNSRNLFLNENQTPLPIITPSRDGKNNSKEKL